MGNNRKTLQELTIKHNFMFAAVMMNPDICKEFLELVLEIPIDRVEVSYEKSMVYHPEYKGVRMDVFAKDEQNTRYNVEMQIVQQALEKRSRYYHSQMDMEMLLSGTEYGQLPNAFVIFVCDFDPFGKKKYRYTVRMQCQELPGMGYDDGSCTLFLSTCGENEAEVPEALVNFLRFVRGNAEIPEDKFVKRLQQTVSHVKASRKMEERFMVLERLLKEERMEGKAEGKAEVVLDFLDELDGGLPEELREKILGETDLAVLRKWIKLAAASHSVEQFIKEAF